jgi:outer membrane protein assembly factor BamB
LIRLRWPAQRDRPQRDGRARRLAPLRALPIAVLVAFLVVAVTARLRSPARMPRSQEVASTAPSASSGPAKSAFEAPLLGPSPPPKANVPPGAPRMVHGNPRHVHRAAARGPKSARVGFRASVGAPIEAQVTVSPDERTLYVATLEGELVALAREDGSRRWSSSLGERVYSTPLVHDDGTIYVGTDGKKLVALSPKGDALWRLEVDGEADSGPTFGKDGTIVFTAGRHVHAARRGGDLAWRFSTKGKVFTSPAVTEEGLVVVGSQDDRVYAIGPSGALAWSVDLGADVDGAPAIADDGAIYVGTDAGEVVRLEGHGKIGWRTPVGGFVRGVLSIARNGDVLVGTYGPVPRVVRVAPDGNVRGAFAIRGTGAREFGIHGGPLEDEDGTLYFGGQDDAVYAVGVDGTLRWRFDTGADVDAPLTMLSDGSLVAAADDGTVTLLLP